MEEFFGSVEERKALRKTIAAELKNAEGDTANREVQGYLLSGEQVSLVYKHLKYVHENAGDAKGQTGAEATQKEKRKHANDYLDAGAADASARLVLNGVEGVKRQEAESSHYSYGSTCEYDTCDLFQTKGCANVASVGCFDDETGFAYDTFRLRQFELSKDEPTYFDHIDFALETETANSGSGDYLIAALFDVDAKRGVCRLCTTESDPSGAEFRAVIFSLTQEELDEFDSFRLLIPRGYGFYPSSEGYTGAEVLTVGLLTFAGIGDGNRLLIGATSDAETAPSYIWAPDCEDGMVTMSDFGFPDVHWQFSVCTTDSLPDAVPAGWTCEASLYENGFSCDCNCGVYDPDCDAVPFDAFNCNPANERCVRDEETGDGVCAPLPEGTVCEGWGSNVLDPDSNDCWWTYYNAQDGCDCCGCVDPDCAVPDAPLYNCEGGADEFTCAEGQCVAL